MKTTSNRSTCMARGPGPLNSKNCSTSIPLTVANFFQKYFVHKKWRGGGELLSIKCAIDSYAYKSC